jgi:hypothetical protein
MGNESSAEVAYTGFSKIMKDLLVLCNAFNKTIYNIFDALLTIKLLIKGLILV